MEFTGSELIIKRNFYSQTGMSWFGLNCRVDNTSGTYHFGLSGTNGVLDFKLESGRILHNDRFLHSYRSFEEFIIEGAISPHKFNLTKNTIPLLYGADKNTGAFDYFYFQRDKTSSNAEFDLVISGDNVPSYEISNNGYLFTTGQDSVTGYFINRGEYPIRVFNSAIFASAFYDFGKLANTNIERNQTGIFTLTGDFAEIDLSQPILTTFNTNFGDTTIIFNIIDVSTANKFVFLNDIEPPVLSVDHTVSRNLSYLNFSGGFVASFDTHLTFALEHITGSGDLKTFTGSWDMYTGLSLSSLASVKSATTVTDTQFSGVGVFQPNSFVAFQIVHHISGENTDVAKLTITGIDVINNMTYLITGVNV
jgi:hypothetical protein